VEVENAEHGAIFNDRKFALTPACVHMAVVVGGTRVGGPHIAHKPIGAALAVVAADFVNLDDGFALVVVTGDDAANGRVDRVGHSMGS
jgi:hypothetical protein